MVFNNYSETLGEIADKLLDPERKKKYDNYQWLKNRKVMMEDPKFHPWKAEGYTTLWDIADKLRVDRSEMSHTNGRWRKAVNAPQHLDSYYQPLIPDDKVVEFLRWVKQEGFKKWRFDAYDLSEEEVEEVNKTRNELIRDAVLTYPVSGKKLKRTGWPWLVPLRIHAGIPDITNRERSEACQKLQEA